MPGGADGVGSAAMPTRTSNDNEQMRWQDMSDMAGFLMVWQEYALERPCLQGPVLAFDRAPNAPL